MGISIPSAKKLIEYKNNFSLSGEVLTFGRQDICFNRKALFELINSDSFASRMLSFLPQSGGKNITDKDFFRKLGYKSITSVDISDYENADVLHDMNQPHLSNSLRCKGYIDKYDFILDGGTMEHCFNIPQFLENAHSVLKVGGCIMHITPMNNYVDHGFYQFSPTFFQDWYSANNYEILDISIAECNTQTYLSEKKFSKYKSNMEYNDSYIGRIGSLDNHIYDIFCLVRKLEFSTGNVIPQQGYYRDKYTSQN